MIRAVFFDYDGVLTTDRTGSLTTTRHLSRATGIEWPVVQAAFSRYNHDLTLGRTTHARIWPELCEALGRQIDIGLLQDAFESTPPNAGMFSLARRLKRLCAVGIVTDNKKDRVDHLRRHQGLDALFDPIVVSAETGCDKSGPEIFLHALRCVGVRPAAAVFVDNSAANLVAARALGIHTVLHDDAVNDIASLARTLQSLGLAVNDG